MFHRSNLLCPAQSYLPLLYPSQYSPFTSVLTIHPQLQFLLLPLHEALPSSQMAQTHLQSKWYVYFEIPLVISKASLEVYVHPYGSLIPSCIL